MEEVDFDIPDTCPIKHLAILGIGLNVNSDVRRNPGLHSLATSIRCELGGKEVSREELFANICFYLEENISKSQEELHQEFLKYQLFKPDTEVMVHSLADKKSYSAQVVEIKNNWNIVFRTSTGDVKDLDSSLCSVRPRCSKIIYVVKGGNLNVSSSQQLYRILLSLVDTSQYSIKYLKMEDIEKGLWKDNCSLVVIGDTDSSIDCDWSKSEEMMKGYLENGGGLLCIGRSLNLFEVTKPVIGKVVNEGDKLDSESTGTFNCEVIVHLQENGNGLPVELNLCCHGNCVELKATDPTDVAIALYPTCEDSTAILTKKLGKGNICMCGFDVEFSSIFQDLESPTESKTSDKKAEENVFQEDVLFQYIFKHLNI